MMFSAKLWFLLRILISLMLSGVSTSAQPKACELNLSPPADIDAETFYVDPKGSVASPEIVERNRVAMQALDGAIWQVTQRSNWFLQTRESSEARCATQMLAVFAKRDAMLGVVNSRQARVERLWRATGLAVIYLTERRFAAHPDQDLIDRWIRRLAFAVRDDFKLVRNNGRYWLGLLSYSAGLAVRDRRLIDAGLQDYRDGLASIGDDGSLSEEMKRGRKALHYHNFAVAPLVELAEIGEVHGLPLYDEAGGALRRLAVKVCSGVLDIKSFNSGDVQDPIGVKDLVWLAFYARRFPGSLACDGVGFEHRNPALGGNLDLLAHYWAECLLADRVGSRQRRCGEE